MNSVLNRLCGAVVVLGVTASVAAGAPKSLAGCQILDVPSSPVYQVGVSYLPESEFEGYDESAIVDVNADSSLGYFRDVFYGDLDARLILRGQFFTADADLDLPGQVGRISIDAGWSGRYGDGMGLLLRFLPGMYSDLGAMSMDGLYLPFSVSLVKAFDPYVSGVAGAEIRPGFKRTVMPLVGLVWQAADSFRMDLRIPRSRVTWFINKKWDTHLGAEWDSTTYAIDDERDAVNIEDFRAWWGITHWFSPDLQLTGEIGRSLNRSVEFEEDSTMLAVGDDEIDVANATYFRIGVGGPF